MLTQTTPVRSKWGSSAASVCHSDLIDEVIKGAWPLSHDNMGLRLDRCVTHSLRVPFTRRWQPERWRTWGWQKRREGVRDEVDVVTREGRRERGRMESGRGGGLVLGQCWLVFTCVWLKKIEEWEECWNCLSLLSLFLFWSFTLMYPSVPVNYSLHYLFLSSFNPSPLLHFPIPFLSPFSSSSFFTHNVVSGSLAIETKSQRTKVKLRKACIFFLII